MLKIIQSLVHVCLLMVFLGGSQVQASGAVSYDDPWEGVNRVTFGFNDALDRWLLKPVATGYDTVTPKPVQGLVSNFFQNLGEIRNVANSVLQFKILNAGESTGRFLVNSTVGMLGMLDVASGIGLKYHYEDFGLTLARWNVPSGPYVVVPLLGPRTLRSTVGIYPDMQLSPVRQVDDSKKEMYLTVTDVVSLRAALLEQENLIVGDKYTFIRDAYLQRRQYLSTGELPQDDF